MADQDFISGALAGQQFQLNKFLIQEAPVKLEQEKLALKVGQQDYQRRQQMADLLAKNSAQVPEGQDPLMNAATSMFSMGQAAAKSGLVEEATKDFKDGSTIMAQREDAAYKQWQTVFQQTKYADQLLATIPAGVSQEEGQRLFDQMNAHIKMTTGQASKFEGQRYSAELVEQLRDASRSKRTAAQEALTKAQEEKSRIDAEADRLLPELRRSQINLNKAREKAAAKVGGDGLTASPKNISAVTDYLVKDSADQMSPADARVFARDIALDAEQRMKDNHQTQPQAVAAAVKYAKEHGALAGIAPAHTRPGSSAKKPLPLPSKPEDFKDQMWYQTPKGPQWYDAETGMVYPPGSGPDDEDTEE